MTVAPPAEAPTAPEAADTVLAPLLLPQDLRLTPEQFALVCEANPEAVLELAADGQLITITPTGGETGARNINLAYQLAHWARSHGSWKLFDSSTGFRLADGSVLSPDADVATEPQRLENALRLEGGDVLPGLVLELGEIWAS
jgi:Uma2 family endonuclease